MKISIEQVCQYMVIFFKFLLTSNHLHPLQVENWDSNSQFIVDEDENGKFRLERVKPNMKQIHKAVQALESDIGFWRPSWILLKKLKNA